MYYHDSRLQYPVTVDKPNPAFATLLQQAIGGLRQTNVAAARAL